MKRIISNRSVIGSNRSVIGLVLSGWGFAACIVAGFVAADLDARGGYNA